jgi:orotate phosphoribosyltransferase
MNPAEVALSLLQLDAIMMRPKQPFTWSSGQLSPIYCDMRRIMANPDVRQNIAAQFAQHIAHTYPQTTLIAGTATAGIPHAAWLADKLHLPMIYVRSQAKGHGTQSQIEGVLATGQPTIVVEDLLSTGSSALQAVEAINQAGGHVQAVVAIFSYGLKQATDAFAKKGVPFYALCTLDALLPVAQQHGVLTAEEVALLLQWRNARNA